MMEQKLRDLSKRIYETMTSTWMDPKAKQPALAKLWTEVRSEGINPISVQSYIAMNEAEIAQELKDEYDAFIKAINDNANAAR